MLANWVSSLSNFKQVALRISNGLLARTHVEEIEDESGIKGAKAVWKGEPGESGFEVNAPAWKGNFEIGGDTAPTIEYQQQGDRRRLTVHNAKDISFEVDQKTLSKITTAKGAWIAAIAGAGAGLLGWFLLALANRSSLVREERKDRLSSLHTSDSTDSEINRPTE